MLDDSIDLVCPRCGLIVRPRARWLRVEHCPRCIAYYRIAVRMSSGPASGGTSGRHGDDG